MANLAQDLGCDWKPDSWGEPLSILERLMSACTLLRMGRDDCSLGSGRPREICMFWTAERYDFSVCGARPLSARKAAKQQSKCSDTGKGLSTLYFTQKPWNHFIAAWYVFWVDGARLC